MERLRRMLPNTVRIIACVSLSQFGADLAFLTRLLVMDLAVSLSQFGCRFLVMDLTITGARLPKS